MVDIDEEDELEEQMDYPEVLAPNEQGDLVPISSIYPDEYPAPATPVGESEGITLEIDEEIYEER